MNDSILSFPSRKFILLCVRAQLSADAVGQPIAIAIASPVRPKSIVFLPKKRSEEPSFEFQPIDEKLLVELVKASLVSWNKTWTEYDTTAHALAAEDDAIAQLVTDYRDTIDAREKPLVQSLNALL